MYLSIGRSLQPVKSLPSLESLSSLELLPPILPTTFIEDEDDYTQEIVAELEKVKKKLTNNNDKMSIQLKIINQLKKLYK